MIVRCGRCQAGFDVPGPGRHVCPACGTANEVSAGAPEPPMAAPPAAPPEPAAPSPRASCTECGLSFIVGDVASAPCPNCGTDVPVGGGEEAGS